MVRWPVAGAAVEERGAEIAEIGETVTVSLRP